MYSSMAPSRGVSAQETLVDPFLTCVLLLALGAHGLRNEVAPWRESAPQPLSFTPRAQGWWILLAC